MPVVQMSPEARTIYHFLTLAVPFYTWRVEFARRKMIFSARESLPAYVWTTTLELTAADVRAGIAILQKKLAKKMPTNARVSDVPQRKAVMQFYATGRGTSEWCLEVGAFELPEDAYPEGVVKVGRLFAIEVLWYKVPV